MKTSKEFLKEIETKNIELNTYIGNLDIVSTCKDFQDDTCKSQFTCKLYDFCLKLRTRLDNDIPRLK